MWCASMFGYVIDLSGVRSLAQRVLDAQWRTYAGLAFMALAMVAIQYDEIIAPEVTRISDAMGGVAADFNRRLASFTL